jgi:hypothetical protein
MKTEDPNEPVTSASRLKDIAGGCSVYIVIMIGMLMLLMMFLKSIPWIAENVFPWVSFSTAITLLVIVPICLILAIFTKTPGQSPYKGIVDQ